MPATTPTFFPVPRPGAALPLTFHPSPSTSVLVIGSGKLAASRSFTFLEAGARVVVAPTGTACAELAYRIQHGQVEQLDLDGGDDEKVEYWLDQLQRIDDTMLVAVTDTVINAPHRRSVASVRAIHTACRRLHLPINVSDHPTFCTYTFPAVHRFPSSTGPGDLQIAVSTNGRGCRLAGRIKRDLASGKALPRDIGSAVENIGRLRDRAKIRDRKRSTSRSRTGSATAICADEDEAASLLGSGPLNSPVPQLATPSISRTNSAASSSTSLAALRSQTVEQALIDEEEQQIRRMRWVSQVSEYWSIEYLARMTSEDVDRVLQMWGDAEQQQQHQQAGGLKESSSSIAGSSKDNKGSSGSPLPDGGTNAHGQSSPSPYLPTTPRHDLELAVPNITLPKPKGRILLLGSGPGHPGLLTVAAHTALNTATLILSDKLVPSEILALIPSTTTLHIAKKFPGNAEGAQNEMMELALEGALRGEVVVRLKQGDPFVYGRGGEEVLFFREHGFECTVVPGVSSALAGPLMFGVPVTQRGVAESMILCTGVGRKGKAVQLPGYVRSRSLVVLMGVARLRQVLDVLQRSTPVTDPETQGWRDGAAYPAHLPIAIIERASSHDQRMVASTLEGIEDALERSGDQRPPGMMIIGWAVLALEGQGEVTVLDDEDDEVKDRARVTKWLAGKPYVLKDGLNDEWKALLPS